MSFALDAVIIGASSIKHLEENIKSTKHGPLHEGELNLTAITFNSEVAHICQLFYGRFFGEKWFRLSF